MLINIITNGLLLTPEMVDRLTPCGLNGVKITLDGDRDTHNRMRPLRGGQGTFDRIIAERPRGRRQVPDLDRRQLRRELGRQLSGAARLPRASRTSPTSSRRSRSSRSSASRSRQQPKGLIPLTVVGARRQAAERHVHDVGGHRRQPASATPATSSTRRCRFCARRRRSAGSRPSTACTWGRARFTASTPTRSAPTGRSTPAPASPARRSSRPATSTGARTSCAQHAAHAVRAAGGVEEVQRLRVHPGLRRRLHGRGAHRARRHEPAELPQDQLRGRGRLARARCGIRPGSSRSTSGFTRKDKGQRS